MNISGCIFPEDLVYDAENLAWGKVEDDLFYVGATQALVWACGGVKHIQFKPKGSMIRSGQFVAGLDGVRAFMVVKSPVEGSVVDVNTDVAANPRLLNRNPYANWLCKLSIEGGQHGMAPVSDVAPTLESKLNEIKVRCHAAFPDKSLFELGSECSAVLTKLSEELTKMGKGDVVLVVSDEPTAQIEITRWSIQTGNKIIEAVKKGGVYEFLVEKV